VLNIGNNYWLYKDLEICCHSDVDGAIEHGIIVSRNKGITFEGCFFHDLKFNVDYNSYRRAAVDGPRVMWGSGILIGCTDGAGFVIRNCISQDNDGFIWNTHGNNVLIDGCTIKRHPFNTIMSTSDTLTTVSNCVFMDNGGQRSIFVGGTDLMTGETRDIIIENCEFGNRRAYPGDPDGCAVDFECNTANAVIRQCDIHGCDAYALMYMALTNHFTNSGMVDCLLRYNGSIKGKCEIANRSSDATGPITGNTYYLAPNVSFLEYPAGGALTIENNTAGTKSHVATPMANYIDGTHVMPLSVTLSCATAGAVIHYTTDGSYPRTTSPVYTDPIVIDRTTALNAKAFKDGMEQSYSLCNVYTCALPYITVNLLNSLTHQKVSTPAKIELLLNGSVVDMDSGNTAVFTLIADSGSGYTMNISAAGYVAKSGIGAVLSISGAVDTITLDRKPLTGIDVQPDTLAILSNSSSQLLLYGVYSDETRMLWDGALVPDWISRSPGMVSANGSGLLSSHAQEGSCFVVATIPSLGLSDSIEVRVIYAPLLRNPSFESPAIVGLMYNPPDSGWAFVGGSGIQHNSSDFGATNAPDGVQTAFLQNTGSFSQIVYFDSSSYTYKIKFKAAMRSGFGGLETFDVYWDSTKIGTFTPQTANFQDYVIDDIAVPKGSYLLKFAGTTSVGDNTAFIDSVGIEVSGLFMCDEPNLAAQEKLSLVTSPNPFNPSVNIRVSSWKSGMELKILNINGQVVTNLTSALNSGSHGAVLRQVTWNASSCASGVYLVILKNGKEEIKRKIMLIR